MITFPTSSLPSPLHFFPTESLPTFLSSWTSASLCLKWWKWKPPTYTTYAELNMLMGWNASSVVLNLSCSQLLLSLSFSLDDRASEDFFSLVVMGAVNTSNGHTDLASLLLECWQVTDRARQSLAQSYILSDSLSSTFSVSKYSTLKARIWLLWAVFLQSNLDVLSVVLLQKDSW